MRTAVLLLLFALSPLASFADEAADRAALEAAARAWITAFNAHDADALMRLATADVALVDPTVNGPQAVRTAWTRASQDAQGQVSSITREVVIAGDVAWRTAALTHKLANGEVAARGQSLEIWKHVSGEWKLHRQMSSSILTLPRLRPGPPPSRPALDAPTQ